MSTDDQAHRIQELIECIEASPDINMRELMQECLQAVLAMHGAGLERILKLVSGNTKLRDALVNDDVVRGLLLIHGLHPVPLEARMQQALDKVLPYIRSHGGDVQLVTLTDGVATLRLQGTCKTCSASTVTLELAVKAAINEFCPDLLGMEVEGVAQPDGVERECVTTEAR
jgi:Fe-S cluster biogenesis protein NfuA